MSPLCSVKWRVLAINRADQHLLFTVYLPGVLVRYSQRKGGILLVPLHPCSNNERDALITDAAAHVGVDTGARDKAAVEIRLWLDRDTDAQITLPRRILWNLGVE